MTWKKSICQCGTGEQHYRYDRSDMSCVTCCDGKRVTDYWFGWYIEIAQHVCRFETPVAAMNRINVRYPMRLK